MKLFNLRPLVRERSGTGQLARRRLDQMLQNEQPDVAPEYFIHMKKEIAGIVARYVNAEPDSYEIHIELKQKRV